MTVLKLASKSWSWSYLRDHVSPLHLIWIESYCVGGIIQKHKFWRYKVWVAFPDFFPIKFICCGVLKPGFYNPPKSWFKCGIIRQMVDCKWMNPGCIKWRALFIIMWDRVRCESNSMCCAVVFILAFIILLFCFGLFIYGTSNNNFYPWNWLAMPPLNRKSHKFLGKNTILVCVVY